MSLLDLAMRLERDPSGRMGPKGCDPLAWSPPQRIPRSLPLWRAPQITGITLTATPQLIVQPDPLRALLIFELNEPPGSAGAGYAQICPTQHDAQQVPPNGFFGISWPQGTGMKLTTMLSYEQQGAITTDGWWGVCSAGQTCHCSVYARQYYG
jgi:hypothetical protein